MKATWGIKIQTKHRLVEQHSPNTYYFSNEGRTYSILFWVLFLGWMGFSAWYFLFDVWQLWIALSIVGMIIGLAISIWEVVEKDTKYESLVDEAFEIIALNNGRESSMSFSGSGSGMLTFLSVAMSGSSKNKNVFRFIRKRDGGYSTIETITGSGKDVRIFEDSEDGKGYVYHMVLGVSDKEFDRIKKLGKEPAPLSQTSWENKNDEDEEWVEIHVPAGTVSRDFSIKA